jgi:antitoxin component HigA of HigAB toxin-antitoxin module
METVSTQVLDEYTELLLEHRPMVPKNESEHARMVEILESIDLSGKKPSKAEKRLADLIAAAILTYEEQVCPPLPMQPHEVLVQLMENRMMTQADLARLLGVSRTTANHIVHGTQGISKRVALVLAQHFAIDVEALLGGIR